MALGVLYCDQSVPAYDQAVHEQLEKARDIMGVGDMKELRVRVRDVDATGDANRLLAAAPAPASARRC